MDLLFLYLEGHASWYIDSLTTATAYLALRLVLTYTFTVKKQTKMDILKMKKMDIESNRDFVYRVDKETLKLKLPEEPRGT